ncbi:ArsR/SmtB family transcription factor [Magnetovibrio sp.]|uniref:ArsR/SmtB family transcription factor n=1 Tax=Magnetovibrio sp. TaxID=2024836 RepID=UPI002F92D5F5
MSKQTDTDTELAALCKALGHPARVKIVRHMLKVNACYFGGLTEVLNLAPSTISQHVSALKKAGIITEGEKDCRSCHCIEADKLQRLKTLIDAL